MYIINHQVMRINHSFVSCLRRGFKSNVLMPVFLVLLLLGSSKGWGQISVANSGSVYTQKFDCLGTCESLSLPANWRAQDNAPATGTRPLDIYANYLNNKLKK